MGFLTANKPHNEVNLDTKVSSVLFLLSEKTQQPVKCIYTLGWKRENCTKGIEPFFES